jgi:hypothetical protein
MPKFLDTRGNQTLSIGICARCSRKFPLGELFDDPNVPELKVCKDDRDDYDPWRLPPREPEKLNPPFIRPDRPLTDNLTNLAAIIEDEEIL